MSAQAIVIQERGSHIACHDLSGLSRQRCIHNKGGSVKFSYDPVTQKVGVHMKGDTTFMLSGDIPDILGFGTGDAVVTRTSLDRKTLTQGYSIVDLRRGFESLYVYSSIVEPRIVGDKIAPLLRIVPITGRHG